MEAIDVAERAACRSLIAGIIQDQDYFEQLVEPRLDGERVRYVGPVEPDRRGGLLGGATALLHLVNFDEPFGFSVVEAMACGTPVIARRRGSMAEIVRHGENGFLVDTDEEAVAAVPALSGARPDRRAGFGGRALRRRADGGRLPRGLSARRRAPPRRARGRPLSPGPEAERFRVGVNYWPARTAMGWWTSFEPAEVEADFARIAACGLDSVRVFLTWEDFQPAPNRVDRSLLEQLVRVADLAAGLGLDLMPTLFTGHMSGVNWIPAWALGGSDGDPRFRVVSGGSVVHTGLRNWYTDRAIAAAQALLAREAAAALAGHEAIWAWDLGNENSNCVIPPTRSAARAWLDAPHLGDPQCGRDGTRHGRAPHGGSRRGSPARPAGGSKACDLLSMHGYPIYARWADGPIDDHLLPFLARVTHWLGESRDLFSASSGCRRYASSERMPRWPTRYGERHMASALGRRAGCLGALLWCYSDYDRRLGEPAVGSRAPRALSFGLWRADGSPKPAVAAIAAFVGAERCTAGRRGPWIDIGPDEFRLDPQTQLPRLYRRYRTGSRWIRLRNRLRLAGAASTASSRSARREVARQIELSAAP